MILVKHLSLENKVAAWGVGDQLKIGKFKIKVLIIILGIEKYSYNCHNK